MKKLDYFHDYLCSREIAQKKRLESKEYGQIYYKTNEDLVDAYLDTEFREKDVFSVLASSDQVLTARFLDAKSVDAFDRNKLTLYYFYLRMWSLKYKKEMYPKIMDRNAHNWMNELIKKIKPQSREEVEAILFFIKHQDAFTNYSNLFFDEYLQDAGSTLYQKPEELEDCLSTKIDFTCMDFFQPFNSGKDYDIVLMSNILDLADEKGQQVAAENLARLVRPEGSVICSNLIYKPQEKVKREEELFSPYFEKEQKQYGYIYHRK